MIPFEKEVRFVTAIRHTKHEEDEDIVYYVEQRLDRALKDYSRWVESAFPRRRTGRVSSDANNSKPAKPARQLKFEGQNLRGYEAAELQPIFDRYCPPL